MKLAGTEVNMEGLLSFLRRHDVFMFLNSNCEKQVVQDKYSSFDWVLAAGVCTEITSE